MNKIFDGNQVRSWSYLRKYLHFVLVVGKFPGLLRYRGRMRMLLDNIKTVESYLEMKTVPDSERERHTNLLQRASEPMPGFAPLMSAETVTALAEVASQRARNQSAATRRGKRGANNQPITAKRTRRSAESRKVDKSVQTARDADARFQKLNDIVPVNGTNVDGALHGLTAEN